MPCAHLRACARHKLTKKNLSRGIEPLLKFYACGRVYKVCPFGAYYLQRFFRMRAFERMTGASRRYRTRCNIPMLPKFHTRDPAFSSRQRFPDCQFMHANPSLAQLREQMQNLIARPHEPQKLLVSNHRFKVRHRCHRSTMNHAISKQHIATHCKPKLLGAKPLLQIDKRIFIQWKQTPALRESYSERQCPAHTAPSGIENSYSIQRDYVPLSYVKPTDSKYNDNTECE